jgi:hypothetical protein
MEKIKMQEKLVNLTGNDITIVGNYKQIVATIPRSSKAATIRFEREIVRQINGRLPLVRIPDEMIWIEGVPDPEPGVLYIVSSIIAQHLRRPDVISPDTAPGGMVKVNGRLVGVRGFQYWGPEDAPEED